MSINAITAGNGANELSAQNKIIYEKNLLQYLMPKLQHVQLGSTRYIPKNGGTTIEFTKYQRIVAPKNPSALVEGVTPSGKALSVTKLDNTPNQYGDYVVISDRLQLQGKDDNIVQASGIMGDLGGETFDVLARNVLSSGTTVQYQGGKTAITALDNTCRLSVYAFKKATRTLRRKYNTPSDGYFPVLCHADTIFDLSNDPEWISVYEKNAPVAIYKNEIGTIAGCRVISCDTAYVNEGAGASTNVTGIKTTGSAADVYYSLVLASEAFGVVKVGSEDNERPSIIVKTPESGGTEDPLNQRNTVGYKGMFGALLLDDDRYVVIKHTVSA